MGVWGEALMKQAVLLLVMISLSACNYSNKSEVLKKFADDCKGDLTVTLGISTFSDGATVACHVNKDQRH